MFNNLILLLHANVKKLWAFFFHLDKNIDTIDHSLNKFDFRCANTPLVGDIKFTIWTWWGVLAASTTGLKTHFITEIFKIVNTHLLVKFW